MAKLLVKPQVVYAGGLAPAGNVAQPGSTVGGVTVYSGDPTTLQALAAWANGLAAQLNPASGGLNSQVLEEMNGILYVLTYQLAYLKQAGVPEWDSTVAYYIGSIVQDGTGVLWVSKTDNNVGNALAAGANWKTYASTLLGASSPLLKAWVVFDGRTGAIDASFNVNSVARTSAGVYLVTFAAAMADAVYGFAGSCGTRAGEGWISGDDNLVCGGAPGKTVIRTTAQCSVFSYDRGNTNCEDSSLVAVNFFGNP